MNKCIELAKKLCSEKSLTIAEYEYLIENRDVEVTEILRKEAVLLRKEVYGKDVYIRGLLEITNVCKNDCYYCGIRKSNRKCKRYKLSKGDILNAVIQGYKLGFRTFVLQGGENPFYKDDVMVDIIKSIKVIYPDVAITLSIGERSKESYQRLFDAGADRYLLRHETANKEHYQKLHPEKMSFENRMRCLNDLKQIGYQVGAGFMVGSPYQTNKNLAEDLKFIEEFKPDMCGIGPYISHKDTPFKKEKSGSVELTCFLLSIIRIIHKEVLLPATTALGTMDEMGREKGILSGANVVMPNLSPEDAKVKYELYDNKVHSGLEEAENLNELSKRFEKIGYKIVISRGDIKKGSK